MNPMRTVDRARAIVMVERHLHLELRLLEMLEQLGETLKTTLETAGSRGLTLVQSDKLNAMVDQLSNKSDELKKKREQLLSQISVGREPDGLQSTIRQFIRSLDKRNGERLEVLRMSLLDRLTEIHATFVGNQAVLFYSYDFYRKMVAGILNSDLDENQYSMSGQTPGVKPGNLVRKAV